jgi:hypothetical protein
MQISVLNKGPFSSQEICMKGVRGDRKQSYMAVFVCSEFSSLGVTLKKMRHCRYLERTFTGSPFSVLYLHLEL